MPAPRVAVLLRCLVLAGGMLLAAATMPLGEVLVLFVLATFMGGLAIVLVSGELEDEPDARARASVLRAAATPAVVTGAATIGLAALASASALLALLVLVTVVACSSVVRDAVRTSPQRVGGPRTGDAPGTSAGRPPVVPLQRGRAPDAERARALTSPQLCAAWRESYHALHASTSPLERVGLVEWRRTCLDELEMRHPRAVAAWLGSGSPAARGLEEFLSPEG
ncbi:MAG: hypothetical protein JWR42_224 [Marmoricola sp.]|nr:hypothetical protein [Marmoricola sp.]